MIIPHGRAIRGSMKTNIVTVGAGIFSLTACLLSTSSLVASFESHHNHLNNKNIQSSRLVSSKYRRNTPTGTVSSLLMGKQSFNPFTSMIGDMASSLFSSSSKLSSSEQVDEAIQQHMASSSSSWDDIRSILEKQQTPAEQSFRKNLPNGYGKGSPLHKLRLFDESNKEEDVRVTLYRDSASWCPYCQKVWTMLEEKKIPYKIEKINMRCYGEKPVSFRQLQPSGAIPVAIIDGKVYSQSNDIMYALEQLFPEHKSLMVPKGQEMKGQQLLRLERTIFSAWMYWLTSNSDGTKRLQNGFENSLKEVEDELSSSGPFFMGNDITIVDLMFLPFMERMCASLLFFKGFTIRVPTGTKTPYPNVNKWFDALEKLDSYQLTKSDYYTHCWDLPPQLGGCTYEDAGTPFENAINGVRSLDGTQGSWEFPLQKDNGGVEPDWNWINDDEARREAVERLSANYEAITKFASRGAGQKGMPPYSAQLADPNAVPNEGCLVGVDSILRTVCMAMLDSDSNMPSKKYDDIMAGIAALMSKEGGKEYTVAIISCLTYLRDRIGVPRDMTLPAARQLRAYLNWSIGKILD